MTLPRVVTSRSPLPPSTCSSTAASTVSASTRSAGRWIGGSAIHGCCDSKAEIVSTLFDETLDTLLRRVGEVDDDPQVELERIVRAFVELTIESEALAAIWVREQRSLSTPDRRLRHIAERWADRLERCYPDSTNDDPRTVALLSEVLFMSEARRPPTGRHAHDPGELLVAMARSSLDALAQASTNDSSASSSSAGLSSIG